MRRRKNWKQIDRLQFASKTSSAEIRSNNSGRFTLLKSHIPWHLPTSSCSSCHRARVAVTNLLLIHLTSSWCCTYQPPPAPPAIQLVLHLPTSSRTTCHPAGVSLTNQPPPALFSIVLAFQLTQLVVSGLQSNRRTSPRWREALIEPVYSSTQAQPK